MKPSSVARAAGAAVLFVLVSVAAEAQQPVTKAPPRLPANPTASGRIPAGVDTGSPASSDTLQLGTPVPPALGAESSEMRARGSEGGLDRRERRTRDSDLLTRRSVRPPHGADPLLLASP